jgi:hypothetical protein
MNQLSICVTYYVYIQIFCLHCPGATCPGGSVPRYTPVSVSEADTAERLAPFARLQPRILVGVCEVLQKR